MIFSVPLVLCGPVQVPVAVQLAAFVDDQVSVEGTPTVTEDDDNDNIGAPGGTDASAASACMNP